MADPSLNLDDFNWSADDARAYNDPLHEDDVPMDELAPTDMEEGYQTETEEHSEPTLAGSANPSGSAPNFTIAKERADFMKSLNASVAKDNKFSGEFPPNVDQAEAMASGLKMLKFRVNRFITMCAITTDEDRCQVLLSHLTGRAEEAVASMPHITFEAIMTHLENLGRGVASGPTVTSIKCMHYNMLHAGQHTAIHKTRNVIPDVAYILGQYDKLLEQLPDQPGYQTCAYLINSLRDIPNLASRLKRVNVDGVTVEQTDPHLLRTELMASDAEFKAAVASALRHTRNPNKRPPPSDHGASGSGWKDAAPPKKGYTSKKASPSTAAKPPYNPFLDPKANRSPTPKGKCFPWVAGIDGAEKRDRDARNICFICNSRKPHPHGASDCPHAQKLFDERKFCYFSKSK